MTTLTSLYSKKFIGKDSDNNESIIELLPNGFISLYPYYLDESVKNMLFDLWTTEKDWEILSKSIKEGINVCFFSTTDNDNSSLTLKTYEFPTDYEGLDDPMVITPLVLEIMLMLQDIEKERYPEGVDPEKTSIYKMDLDTERNILYVEIIFNSFLDEDGK